MTMEELELLVAHLAARVEQLEYEAEDLSTAIDHVENEVTRVSELTLGM